MGPYAQAYLWARVGVLVVFVLFIVIAALVASRPRKGSVAWLLVSAAVSVGGSAAIIWLSGVTISALWSVVFGVLGGVFGWLAGRSCRVAVDGSKVAVRSAAWGVWLVAAFDALAVAALLFGTTITFSAMALLLVFTACFSVVSAVTQVVRINAVRSGKARTAAETSPTPAG